MKVSGNIWICDENGFLLGKGRVQLLEKIYQTGSIMQAAKELNISYRKAWEMIRQLNNTQKEPIVIRTTGGKHGGGAQLTTQGVTLIYKFRKINESFEKFIQRQSELIKTEQYV